MNYLFEIQTTIKKIHALNYNKTKLIQEERVKGLLTGLCFTNYNISMKNLSHFCTNLCSDD